MRRNVQRYLLGVQYKGNRYGGSMDVGKHLIRAIERFNGLGNYENFLGSSRTDTGVHALRNVWHVDLHLKNEVTELEKPGDLVLRALNFYLRKQDILVTDCSSVPSSFECRRQAKYRTYMYRLLNTPGVKFRQNLFQQEYAWNVSELNVEAMQAAAKHLVGIHDFTTFRNSGCQSVSPYRHIWSLEVQVQNPNQVSLPGIAHGNFSDPFLLGGYRLVTIRISANAYVYRMVRNIVSTLVAVGHGKILPESIPSLLLDRNRQLVPGSAPPHGLFLVDVAYNKEDLHV